MRVELLAHPGAVASSSWASALLSPGCWLSTSVSANEWAGRNNCTGSTSEGSACWKRIFSSGRRGLSAAAWYAGGCSQDRSTCVALATPWCEKRIKFCSPQTRGGKRRENARHGLLDRYCSPGSAFALGQEH